MTSKEKAEDLLDLFEIKTYARYAVEQIIEQWEYIDTYLANGNGELNPNLKYWHEVKKELEAL
jgi:hypothetical protein